MSEASTSTPKPVLTKEEKIAKLEANIKALQAKLDDVINDRVPAPKAKKQIVLPEVGAKVIVPVGRNTATSKASTKEGVVVAVKAAVIGEDGKTISAAQVRVQVGEGFDAQFVTVYPAQLTIVEADDGISDRPLGDIPA